MAWQRQEAAAQRHRRRVCVGASGRTSATWVNFFDHDFFDFVGFTTRAEGLCVGRTCGEANETNPAAARPKNSNGLRPVRRHMLNNLQATSRAGETCVVGVLLDLVSFAIRTPRVGPLYGQRSERNQVGRHSQKIDQPLTCRFPRARGTTCRRSSTCGPCVRACVLTRFSCKRVQA